MIVNSIKIELNKIYKIFIRRMSYDIKISYGIFINDELYEIYSTIEELHKDLAEYITDISKDPCCSDYIELIPTINQIKNTLETQEQINIERKNTNFRYKEIQPCMNLKFGDDNWSSYNSYTIEIRKIIRKYKIKN